MRGVYYAISLLWTGFAPSPVACSLNLSCIVKNVLLIHFKMTVPVKGTATEKHKPIIKIFRRKFL
jgi:hypothetical protein